jgi:16S rRNA (uracil1498-N3)-methyltransferase
VSKLLWQYQEAPLNLILLFPDDFTSQENRVRLQGRRLRHVLEVHRASIGDELCVGLANGNIGTGKITHLTQSFLEMEVQLTHPAPPLLPLTLILALPRPKVLRRVLRSVSALGVKKIILLNCFRVEKSYWQSPMLSPDAVQGELILGLEQARDTAIPEVLLQPLFKPFVEDELPALIKGTLALAAHPTASLLCPRDIKKTTTLAIGPEGGFIPYEMDKLVQCGFTPVHMGERILSVETAVPALISRLY